MNKAPKKPLTQTQLNRIDANVKDVKKRLDDADFKGRVWVRANSDAAGNLFSETKKREILRSLQFGLASLQVLSLGIYKSRIDELKELIRRIEKL